MGTVSSLLEKNIMLSAWSAFFMCSVLLTTRAEVLDESPEVHGTLRTSADRISSYNYPVETHRLVTADGYVLTLFRIPYSNKSNNNTGINRPVVLLFHGFIDSSDCWLHTGPDSSLAFLMADAGYDVWLANARGNVYSKKNENSSRFLPKYWDFSWNEIGTIDLPATIDYILDLTNETALHVAAHSQGTTVALVTLSELPSYNDKIKTLHLLAPIAFMKHLKCPARILAPILGHPPLGNLIADTPLLPGFEPTEFVLSELCKPSVIQPICETLLFTLIGFDYENFNNSVIPDLFASVPAGSSTKQLIHYLQEIESGHFRKYDFGTVKNFFEYGQSSPPDYDLKNITAPVRLYYGDNDFLAAVQDVEKLADLLPNVVLKYELPIPEWNHFDFLYAYKVNEFINDKIISAADFYEQTGEQI